MNVNTLAIQAITGNHIPNVSMLNTFNFETFKTLVKNISLLKNPLNGGRPDIEKLPQIILVKVIGRRFISPPNLRISRVPVSWSIIPTSIKRQPLKVE